MQKQRIQYKTGIALIWGLFLCMGGAFAQNTLNTHKVIIYSDLAQVQQKGILRFEEGHTKLQLGINPIPESVEFHGTGEFKIAWYRFYEEKVPVKKKATSWEEILQASVNRNLTIVYQIGADFDEVEGTVAAVNGNQGFVVLNSTRGTDFIIPMDQVRQVIVANAGKLEVDKMVMRKIVALGIKDDVPFVPVEMNCLHKGLSWEPICRIKLQNTKDALITTSAVVRNDSLDLEDVEIELSPSSTLTGGTSGGESVSLGKISLSKGEFITVNLKREEIEYEEVREVEIPWDGMSRMGISQRPAAEHVLNFSLPDVAGLNCSQVSVLDPAGHHIANLDMSNLNGRNVDVSLGKDRNFTVAHSEKVMKEGKIVRIGEKEYQKVEIEGKITVANGNKSFNEIYVKREIFGSMTDPGKATLKESDKSGHQWITWKVTVGGGEKKDLSYTYEGLIPTGK